MLPVQPHLTNLGKYFVLTLPDSQKNLKSIWKLACFNWINIIQMESQCHRKQKKTYMLMKAFIYMLLNIYFAYFFIPSCHRNRERTNLYAGAKRWLELIIGAFCSSQIKNARTLKPLILQRWRGNRYTFSRKIMFFPSVHNFFEKQYD